MPRLLIVHHSADALGGRADRGRRRRRLGRRDHRRRRGRPGSPRGRCGRRAGRGRLRARDACQLRLHERRAQALLRLDLPPGRRRPRPTTARPRRSEGGRKPFGLYVHGRYDTTGAVRSVQSIVGALGWRQSAPVLEVLGEVGEARARVGVRAGRDARGPGDGMRRLLAALATLLAAAVLLSGCTSPTDAPADDATPSPSSTSTPTEIAAPDPGPTPEVGECHALSLRQAVAVVGRTAPVACRRPHTAQTYFVGRLDLTTKSGFTRRVDSQAAQRQMSRACTTRLPRHLGRTPRELRLSMVRAVWFSPSQARAEAGADWFRCDIVAVASPGDAAAAPAPDEGMGRSADVRHRGARHPRVPAGDVRREALVACGGDGRHPGPQAAHRRRAWPRGWTRSAATSRRTPPTTWTSRGRRRAPRASSGTPASATGSAGCPPDPSPVEWVHGPRSRSSEPAPSDTAVVDAAQIRGVCRQLALFDLDARRRAAEARRPQRTGRSSPDGRDHRRRRPRRRADADVVVITAGAEQDPGQSRRRPGRRPRRDVPRPRSGSTSPPGWPRCGCALVVTNQVDVVDDRRRVRGCLPPRVQVGTVLDSARLGSSSPSRPTWPCRTSTPTSRASTATPRCRRSRRHRWCAR